MERRALLAISPLDPTFNGGQPVLTPADSTSTTGLDSASAVTIQTDGRIVVVGRTNDPALTGTVGLAVRRYEANGTPDATFGVGGEVDLFVPPPLSGAVDPASSVLVDSNSRIVVAAVLTPSGNTDGTQTRTLVARLTPTGGFDNSFGLGGETLLEAGGAFNRVALTADNRIVLAGTVRTSTGAGSSLVAAAVTRLALDGSLDPTFLSGQTLTFDPSTSTIVDGLGVTSTGEALVLDRASVGTGSAPPLEPRLHAFQGDGSPNPGFGTSGTVVVSPASIYSDPGAFALQTDGRVLVSASLSNPGPNGSTRLLRFTATGQLDPTFANPTLISTPTVLAVGADGRIVLGLQNDIADLQRLRPDGVIDPTFGPGGRVFLRLPPISNAAGAYFALGGVAVTTGGAVVVAGTAIGSTLDTTTNPFQIVASAAAILQFRSSSSLSGSKNDYDGDNISDLAAELTALGVFAVRPSSGSGDLVQGFGVPGAGQILPAPGDYDGDGRTDIAGYLPALGVLAYRPSSGGPDVYVPFGPAGAGAAIPAPGDYDGDGKTDIALYLPNSGAFAIDPSGGGAPYAVPFGAPGPGQTLPAVGDYDGDGRTDIAVYLPALGEFARLGSIEPSFRYTPVLFGPAGIGAAIPAPGYYVPREGLKFALYLPASGAFAVYNPFTTRGNFAVPFGAAGAGQSIPTPGDYDGDTVTDFAVYLPALGAFAYRSSLSGRDVIQGFGAPGPGQTVPAAALAIPNPGTVHTMSFGPAEPAVFVPLVDLGLEPGPTPKKRS